MATGSSRHTEDYRRRDRLSVRDLNRMTLDVVERVKNDVQSKIRERREINLSEIEQSTFNAKHDLNEREFDAFEWKKAMPSDFRPVQQKILVSAMAYANEVNDVIPIYLAKLDGTSEKNSGNLSDALPVLKSAKRDLETRAKPNIWSIIRGMNDNEIQRANRLFYSEIRHWLPEVPLKMMDVEYVVRAIRDTTYEFEDLQQFLPLVKACGSYEEARGMIKDLEEKSRQNYRERSSLRTTNTTDVRSSVRRSTDSFRQDHQYDNERGHHRQQDDNRRHYDSKRSIVSSRERSYSDDEE